MKKITANKKRIMELLFSCLIMAVVLVCLSGCRDRITNRDDADREIKDQTEAMAESYEKKRSQLDLGIAQKSVLKKRQNKKGDKKAKKAETQKTDGQGGERGRSSVKAGRGKDRGTKRKSPGSRNEDGRRPGGGKKEKEGEGTEKKEKKVTVSFDANGGSCIPGSSDSRKYAAGMEYGSLPDARWSDHSFAGWYTQKDGGTVVNTNSIVPDNDHTLYAHWSERNAKIYMLTFDPNGGRISIKKKSKEIAENQPYGSLPVPVRDGQDFIGWFTSKEGGNEITPDDVFKEKSNQVLYAHWNYDPYRYWSFKLNNTNEKMYACQVVDCYIEFDDNETASTCSLLSDVKIGNCARNRGSNTTVTDEWIDEKNPNAIIKCKGSSSSARSLKAAVAKRFPDRRIIVLPSAAVNGSEHERLFYTLALGKAIYPRWFDDIDIERARSELGVNGNIYE